mgnify:CR=1 FL=1|tara:strand:- start:4386 stop:4850 length:465 start_codon:yes stop_codon:yes gene_type:complete
MSWTNWNDNYVFRTGGTDRMFTLASGAAAVALRAQGLEVTKETVVSLGSFINSGQVVTTGSTATAPLVGKILVCSEGFFVARVVSHFPNLAVTLDRTFPGVSGDYPFIVFPGPAIGVPALNPQSGVVGRAEDQRIPIETTIDSASEVVATLVPA